ncbi:MAG: hypothetical protein HYR96_06295 [Deltaproteobacteria bacterium]|nr:hypothetical protein [Deltaproteobacteria bacterium]MBI3296196.1 hypothetical protein [Deltaproteobacteria bacterium]
MNALLSFSAITVVLIGGTSNAFVDDIVPAKLDLRAQEQLNRIISSSDTARQNRRAFEIFHPHALSVSTETIKIFGQALGRKMFPLEKTTPLVSTGRCVDPTTGTYSSSAMIIQKPIGSDGAPGLRLRLDKRKIAFIHSNDLPLNYWDSLLTLEGSVGYRRSPKHIEAIHTLESEMENFHFPNEDLDGYMAYSKSKPERIYWGIGYVKNLNWYVTTVRDEDKDVVVMYCFYFNPVSAYGVEHYAQW